MKATTMTDSVMAHLRAGEIICGASGAVGVTRPIVPRPHKHVKARGTASRGARTRPTAWPHRPVPGAASVIMTFSQVWRATDMIAKTAEVVICGAGIAGIAAAYHLAA